MLRGLLVVLLLAGPSLAYADEPAERAADQPPSPKRALPDYDGVPPPATTPGEVLVWVPRVVLFPAWLVAEFVIRRPLGLLAVTAERGNWAQELVSFFTFGNQNFGLVPTFYVDLGFRPIFGVYFFYDGDVYSLRVRGSATIDGFGVSVANRFKLDDLGSRVQLQGDASLSPDRAFYGIGPRSLDGDLARYGFLRAGGTLSLEWYPTRGIHFTGGFGIHTNDFKDPNCCGGIPVSELPVPPPGFLAGGYTTMTELLEATFDSRPPRPESQTGVRLRLSAEHSTDLRGSGNWIKAWGTLGGFVDVGRARILGLTLTTALAEPLRGEIPFPELISFGGTGLAMPGLRTDRLYGQSAVSASFRYEWPIWIALAGTLQVECGNVFGPRYEGFDADLLRMSFAFGFRTIGAPDHNFQVIFGTGTETFAQGAALTSFRFAIGGTYGF